MFQLYTDERAFWISIIACISKLVWKDPLYPSIAKKIIEISIDGISMGANTLNITKLSPR